MKRSALTSSGVASAYTSSVQRVTRLDGEQVLESISILGPTGEQQEQACRRLFCFIGADPAMGWLTGVALDEHGFVRTDVQLTSDDLGETWTALGRGPPPSRRACPASSPSVTYATAQ